MAHSSAVLQNWDRFVDLLDEKHGVPVTITGTSLNLASVAAVARHSKDVAVSEDCIAGISQSAEDVTTRLDDGGTTYGVNTGVGASANTRTNAFEDLQQAIVKTLNCGILPDVARSPTNVPTNVPRGRLAISSEDETIETLPISWTRAAQLVRTNALSSGNSGVRVELIRSLVDLLQADIVPRIPLRGSISASGDLSPLSYLAGALQGNRGIQVWTKNGRSRELTDAATALKDAGLTPVSFAPKEALALVNGTSVSAGAAALAMQDANHCMVLAQVLTAMAVEGLNGTDESFDPYFSIVRPHQGQMEAARNIRSFLSGSRLARKAGTENADGLCQDRYSLRTAPQWLGPEIENMVLAEKQIVTECNSITDNPLVKGDGTVLQGGNFQALAVTSAMDKARAALHTTGRMLFQQSTELMNPATNNGLPPNLTADEPSCDFLLKGTDIASASYQSELAFLSHGTTPFVMVAECGNQSLNSMALMSTRYTHKALDLFMQLAANSLLSLCQALDLRATQYTFERDLKASFFSPKLPFRTQDWLGTELTESIEARLWTKFRSELRLHTSLDLEDRIRATMGAVVAAAIASAHEQSQSPPSLEFYAELMSWSSSTTIAAIQLYKKTLERQSVSITLPLLGRASKRIYEFVRTDLEIPFLSKGEPGPQNVATFKGTELGTSIGTFTSRLYGAMKKGEMFGVVMECLRDVEGESAGESDRNGVTNGIQEIVTGVKKGPHKNRSEVANGSHADETRTVLGNRQREVGKNILSKEEQDAMVEKRQRGWEQNGVYVNM